METEETEVRDRLVRRILQYSETLNQDGALEVKRKDLRLIPETEPAKSFLTDEICSLVHLIIHSTTIFESFK